MKQTDSPLPAERDPTPLGGLRRRAGRLAAMLSTFAFLLTFPLTAQQPTTRTLVGVVEDGTTGEVLPSVQVAVRAEGETTASVGSLTDRNGRFIFTALPAGNYDVVFRRLGYAPVEQAVTIDAESVGPVDMGRIALVPAAVEIEEVNVVAQRPAVVHAADRDIYAAESIPGAEGGAVTDVLQGVPDLEVGINGEVTMYGDPPAIYINGREAPMDGESLALFLEQLPAETVETVEVIPNPSARYEAEGAGGIVNIVLKEDVGLGLSGSAFVNAGTRGRLGAGGRGTYQRGPFTLNGGASLRRSSNESTSTSLRENLLVDPITLLEQDGWSDRSSWSGNMDLDADYELSETTELTAEVRVDRDVSEAERVTRYTEMDAARNVLDEYDLILLDDGSGTSLDFALELQHEFARESEDEGAEGGDRDARRFDFRDRGDQLDVEFEFERGREGEDSHVERRILEELGVIDYANELTWEEDRETESEVAVGFDYIRGLGESAELELGYEGEFGWTEEARLEEVRFQEPGRDPISRLDRGFVHRQTVHGGYLTLMRTFGDFSAQVGARAEHAGNRIELPDDGGVHGRDYFSIFPSANLNYTFDESKRVRLSYSQRVRRPSSNVLNPIDTSSDPLNREVGNPLIEPQRTHSYMLNASWSGDVGYLRATPFFRRSVNEWEEIRTVDDDGIATTTYENVGSTDSYGVSFTASMRDFYGIRGRVSLNARHTDRDYSAVVDRPTPSSTRWSLRSFLDREITPSLSGQGSIVYNPPRDLPQGRRSSTLMTRVGLRYRFLDRRASLSVNVTDPFDIYDSSIQRSASGYIETGTERVSMRRLTMSLSYSFQRGGGADGGRRGGPGRRR